MQKNKITTYLLYAIGEIVLVVIGILIAVSINTWNENRKQLREEKLLLNNVYEDLVKDSIQFKYYEDEFNNIEGLHVQLYRIGIKGETLDSINDPSLIRRNVYYSQFINKGFEDQANTIANKKVRESLIDYLKIISDLETAYYSELKPLINGRLRPYLGEQKLHNTDRWFELKSRVFDDYSFDEVDGQNIVDKDKLILLSKNEEFHQILFQLNLKWNEFYSRLVPAIEANNELRSLINKELRKY